MHSVIEKISSKSRTQLLEGFEEKRKTELEARQAVIDDLREELKMKNVEFLDESKKLQQALENHKDAHADTVAQFDRLKLQFEKEVDRHANAETQFSEENLKLKRELDELKLSLDEKLKIAADEKTRIISDHSDEIENMKKYQDAREVSTKKEIQKLQEEVERMGKEETSFHLNIEVITHFPHPRKDLRFLSGLGFWLLYMTIWMTHPTLGSENIIFCVSFAVLLPTFLKFKRNP